MSLNTADRFFHGTYTALITPFKKPTNKKEQDRPKIDVPSLKELIDIQLKSKVEAILIAGTTGQSPTLDLEEELKLFRLAVDMAKGTGTKIIAGTGSNDTYVAKEHSKDAQAIGVDGLLLVNPYYNKPTQTGLRLHFLEIADAVSIPVMLYNIQGRTGVNIETNTLRKIVNQSKRRNILGVKEASGNLDQIMNVIALRDIKHKLPANFSIMSGDDGLTYDIMRMGGDGVVSVVSNWDPKGVKAYVDELVDARNNYLNAVDGIGASNLTGVEGASRHAYKKALQLKSKLDPLFAVAFVQTNPIPVHFGLHLMGLIEEAYRLPMCPLDDKLPIMQGDKVVGYRHPKREVESALIKYGLLRR